MKNFIVSVFAAMFLPMFMLSACLANDAKEAEQQLRAQMPNLQIDSVSVTDMDGIYEVVAGNNIFYYHPKTGNILFGEVWSKLGQSITGNRRAEIVKSKLKIIDQQIDKAVKIGNGKNVVVEFTDPDCPFCRRGYEYFSTRDDVTRMVFFFPLPIHPDAENKSKYVLCAKDKEEAYKEAMTGRLDNKKYEVCDSVEVEEVLKAHKETAAKLGITGTPAYVVNGELIVGADIQRIEHLLGRPERKEVRN